MAVSSNMQSTDQDLVADLSRNKSDSLTDMTEQEMFQHLSLCMKLAAENKINTKNAFGLHLIGIMRQKVKKDEVSDLQFASLSLQASSKIYAGRVEALYKDTFAFHNQLQTIVSNKKVVENKELNDDIDDGPGDEDQREKRRTTKVRQTYFAKEDNVSFKSENTYASTMPHANFIPIKSAFTATRTAFKLLEGLVVGNDNCQLSCSESLFCYKPITSAPVVEISYSEKRKGLIRKVQNLRYCGAESVSTTFCSNAFNPPEPQSPGIVPELNVPSDDDSFCIGTSPVQEHQDPPDVQEIIEKFSVLDITADLLANDLSLAVVNANTVDRQLLPPNSALRKVLNTAEKNKLRKTPMKPRKEKQPREPFFSQEREVDRALFKKSQSTELKESVLQWKLKDHMHQCSEEESILTNFDGSGENDNSRPKALKKVLQENLTESVYGYFSKELRLWNQFGRHTSACLIRPSSLGVCLRNESNLNELEILPGNSNCVADSFQNLSLHNSPARSDDYELGPPPDLHNDSFPSDAENCQPDSNGVEDSFVIENPALLQLSRSAMSEDDFKSVMVTPPELVQPVNMKFQTEPITLNTGKVKSAIWDIVEKGDVLLTDMHKTLQGVFVGEKLPLQYAFTVLLLLANEKCLLLENISIGDIRISKDIPEIS